MRVELTRRSFLRRSAAVSVGLSVLPAAFAEETAKAGEKLLRWGIIGTGARGTRAHIPALKKFAEFEVLGACDVMPNHLDAALKKLGGKCQGYTDYQKLLANRDINAVMIATPNCWHKEIVVAALQAGKHVMCEKPMAASFEECKAIEAAIPSASQVVLFTMQLRYSPHYEAMRKAIEAGKIGKPKYALMSEFRGDWNHGDVWRYTDPKTGKSMNWRYSHAASGGTLSEKVCHYFDILAWMLGENPESVKCDGGIAIYNDGRDTWDHASTVLHYPSGATATHALCMFGPEHLQLQVIGEEASITSTNESPTLIVEARGKREELTPPEEVRHGERGPAKGQETAVLRMYEDFIECVKEHKRPWMSAAKAIASSKTAWLGELSNEQKREVGWAELA